MRDNGEKALARAIAADVAAAGGRVYYVGGVVRDACMGVESKDVDVEVYGILPAQLREILARHGEVYEKGASFGVLGIRHSDLDVAMPRRERRTGEGHRDFDVSVDPFLSAREASMRRDFTINAMMRDVLTGAARVPCGSVRRAAERADRGKDAGALPGNQCGSHFARAHL